MRVVVVKRSRLALEQIVRAVEAAELVAQVVCCQTAQSALDALHTEQAQLGIFGLTFPDLDGLDLIRRALAERIVFRVLVVSSRQDERVRQLMRPGRVDGFFDDERGGFDELVQAVGTVAAGKCYFSREVLSPTPTERVPKPTLTQLFTARLFEVLAVIADGCDDRTAADRLGLGVSTVHTHRKRIMGKLGVRTRPELVTECARRGVMRITATGVVRPGAESDGWRPPSTPGSGEGESK